MKKTASDMPPEQPKPGAVQIMTMHASKGLEWDAVFVPGLNERYFPGTSVDLWTAKSRGDLPWPLRGDAETLPKWEYELASDVREWAGLSGVDGWSEKMAETIMETQGREVLTLKQQVQLHELDEARRLAYVAFTRAKDLLWVSGAHWQGITKRPDSMSVFLEEMVQYQNDLGLDYKAHWAEEFPEENPRRAKAVVARWPYDPLDGPVHYQVEAREDGRLPEPDEHAVEVRRSHPRRSYCSGQPTGSDTPQRLRSVWMRICPNAFTGCWTEPMCR